MKLVAFDQARGPRCRRLTAAGIWLAALLIAVHPVSVEGLWWELSKGRAVANGSSHPTADLIAGPSGADADWLSGVIPYALVTMFGISGLMGLKIAFGVVMTRLLIRRTSILDPGKSWAMTGTALLAVLMATRQAGEPGPVFLDALGFVAVLLATEKLVVRHDFAQLGLVLLLLALWANLGPRVVVGLIVAGPKMWPKPASLFACLPVVAAMIGTVCLTPAGSMTLRNSLIQTWPPLAERFEYLSTTGWQPWWSDLPAAESIAFLILSVVYLMASSFRPSWRLLFVFLAAQVLACASAENLPLSALWLFLTATASPGLRAVPAARSSSHAARSSSHTVPVRVHGSDGAIADEPEKPGWQAMAVCSVWLWVCWAAAHPWMGCESGPGWGLDPRLNPDAFAASLANTAVTENAHCVGVREAGLLSWHVPKGVQPFDTPNSALLNQRLREHVLLTSDLSQRWQTPHQRPDGSWGGWWQTIRARRTTLLIVPAEKLELITALEPTIWKPFSLSAVSLVYGMAGDPGRTQQIVKILSLRQFVDRGAWTYQLSSESGSGPIEFFAGLDDTAATHQSLRLARVFRAMEMHFAALKVLQAIPGKNRRDVRDEFSANQLALGYQERVGGGRSSEFRLRASLSNRQLAAQDIRERLNWPRQAVLPDDDPIAEAISLYVSGDLTRALARLPADRAEALYAKAQLLLEAGQPGQTQSVLKQLIEQPSDRRLSILARQLSATLAE